MSHLQDLQQRLRENGLDAMLLVDPKNRFYVTGFHSSAGAVVVTAEDAWLFTDSRYIEAARAAAHGQFHVGLNDREHPLGDLVRAVLRTRGANRVGGEENALTHGEYLQYQTLLGMELIPAQKLVMELRASKSPEELRRMEQAQEITDRAFARILTILRPGMTEKAVAAELVYSMMKDGAERVSFDPIVVSGVRSSMPHGVPTENVLRPGDFVTMDFGCVYEGYCSDMTRTVAIGSATEEMRRVYDIVLQAQLAGIGAAKAGVLGKDVDRAGREVIEAAGYGACFGHGFGHSLGLDIHESPNASPAGNTPMPLGCVCSAEPGIYLPGQFGVRIEDVVVYEESGCRNLTKSPKELLIV